MKKNIVIYLMRHGLDDESFIGGWSDGKIINEGIKQVESATDYIIKSIYDINCIYNSGLRRTIQTSEIVNKKLQLPLFVLEDLKELNKGKLNGMKARLAEKLYPEYFPISSIYQKYPNGESFKNLYDRVNKFLENIDKYDKSLLITHRGFINMLYFILNDIKLNTDKKQFGVTHSSIHKLTFKNINKIY